MDPSRLKTYFWSAGTLLMFLRPMQIGCRQMFRRTMRIIFMGAFVTVISQGLYAGQITYKLGINADLTTGGSGPELTSSAVSSTANQYVAFYGTHPSLHFDARGERSTLVSMYAFGFDNYTSDQGRE